MEGLREEAVVEVEVVLGSEAVEVGLEEIEDIEEVTTEEEVVVVADLWFRTKYKQHHVYNYDLDTCTGNLPRDTCN